MTATTDIPADLSVDPRVASEPCCEPLRSGELDADEAEQLADRLKALADPMRLRVLALLLGAETGEACTCDLVDALGLSQPTVTHHLQRLAASGLVESERRGRRTWYRPVPAALGALTTVLAPA